MATVASTTPAVLMAHLAANTNTIKVGSGGVMLPNHAPLAIAEQFAMLEALYPGRVDMGVGRAPGTDGGTAMALRGARNDPNAEDFPSQPRRRHGPTRRRPQRTRFVDPLQSNTGRQQQPVGHPARFKRLQRTIGWFVGAPVWFRPPFRHGWHGRGS